ncbi:hypothetical protein BJ944DRAFT_268062 [Cunninghamella echinulata]|nr:hypothetical protein BJ944DRAFT_268062 [Cunninghamella echinulata]
MMLIFLLYSFTHLAPWQAARSHDGEDAWNHSKESREHPQLYSTAYGTTDRIEQMEELQQLDHSIATTTTNEPKSSTNKKSPDNNNNDSYPRRSSFTGGHTIHSKPSPRSIKRDLNNI